MTEVVAPPIDIVIKSPVLKKSTNSRQNYESLANNNSPLDSVSPSRALYNRGLLPSPPPEPDEDELPMIHTEKVDDLMRSYIISAAAASAAHEPKAEAPFFIADLGRVYRQHLRWQTCLPRVTPFYAVKANPDPLVLRLLAALGAGFDCASHNEINMLHEIGVEPDRIIFANPCKPTSFVKHAARVGVDTMTFDNMDELYKIARVHPGAKLVLRILTDDSKSLVRLGLKFGAPLNAVPALLAKAFELKLNVIGISFHVGSGCYDIGAFADAVARAKIAFGFGRDAGYSFSLLDVGGGFEDENFEAAAGILRAALETHFPAQAAVKVIAEPGRYYVADAFTLAANIIALRRVEVYDEDRPKTMYYINDGVYGSFNCIMFDHQTVTPYCLTVGKVLLDSGEEWDSGVVEMCSVWGPTCDSIDCVCSTAMLPRSLEVGDWLGFKKMGAYTVCAASQFNGFDTTQVVYTVGGEMEVVKYVA